MNIFSFIAKKIVEEKDVDITRLCLPKYAAAYSILVGAPEDSATADNKQTNLQETSSGWIYSDPDLQVVVMDPEVALASADHSINHFFPKSSHETPLAYDCLAKTINQALGTLFFSKRQQVVRLIQHHKKYGHDDAGAIKARGGFLMQHLLTPFAISGETAYSLKLRATFIKQEIVAENELHGTNTLPGKVILNAIDSLMLPSKERTDQQCYKELILISYGKVARSFGHAACFVRKDYLNS